MSPTYGTHTSTPRSRTHTNPLTSDGAFLALAAVAVLTACSGADPALKASDAPQATEASAPSVTPEPAVPAGLEWSEVPLPSVT